MTDPAAILRRTLEDARVELWPYSRSPVGTARERARYEAACAIDRILAGLAPLPVVPREEDTPRQLRAAAVSQPDRWAASIEALREYAEDLRERTWLAPVSALEMNHRDHYLANQLDAIVDELDVTAPRPSPDRWYLFKRGEFVLHSGQSSDWKIDCDALTDADIETLAWLVVQRVGLFSAVEGVPSGGLRLAEALRRYQTSHRALLIVDDVLTTGASMEAQRNGREAVGAVLFARGPCPSWVTPLFVVNDAAP